MTAQERCVHRWKATDQHGTVNVTNVPGITAAAKTGNAINTAAGHTT